MITHCWGICWRLTVRTQIKYGNWLFQNPEPQFLGRNTPTQFSVPSLAKYYSRRNTWFTNLPTYLPFSLHWTTIHVGILHCRINSVKWAYEKILSPCCSIVFSGNPSWKRNCPSYSCLSPAGFQFAGLVEEVLGSALKKPNEAHSVRDHHTRAVAGATVRHGLNHFETIPTIEVEAATTNGELKHRGPSTRRWSTASALGRQKGAHSAKE